MWPFRKKPEPKPWRWCVEERLEQQVVAAVQREHWKRAGPILAAQRQAMENAAGRWGRDSAAFRAQANVCKRCHQFHPPVPGDCIDLYRNVGFGRLGGALH